MVDHIYLNPSQALVVQNQMTDRRIATSIQLTQNTSNPILLSLLIYQILATQVQKTKELPANRLFQLTILVPYPGHTWRRNT